MALFRSDTEAPSAPSRSAGNPAEPHTIAGSATALDGSLRAQGPLIDEGAVFNGRCEMETAAESRPAARMLGSRLDGSGLPVVSPASA